MLLALRTCDDVWIAPFVHPHVVAPWACDFSAHITHNHIGTCGILPFGIIFDMVLIDLSGSPTGGGAYMYCTFLIRGLDLLR